MLKRRQNAAIAKSSRPSAGREHRRWQKEGGEEELLDSPAAGYSISWDEYKICSIDTYQIF